MHVSCETGHMIYAWFISVCMLSTHALWFMVNCCYVSWVTQYNIFYFTLIPCLQRSLYKNQHLITPVEKKVLRGHSSNYFHPNSTNYNFHNSHIISPTLPESPIPTVSTKIRPRSCVHCAYLFSGNGAPKFGSIHSTLAYAKCRCHRPDTSKLNSQANPRENHCDNTNGRLLKRAELPVVSEEGSQTVLPSITRNSDHYSEQSLVETSCSELASSSDKFPLLKRYDKCILAYIHKLYFSLNVVVYNFCWSQ